ncbi:MAG: LamG-like jellyroll fold domain-containing protein, partial [Kofleriaceae bacterium]
CTSPWTTTVTEGARTFRVRATDPVGNQSPPVTYAWTVDVTPPTVTLTSVPPALSNNPSPSVGFTVAGGATSIECRVDSGAFAPCASPFAPGALADGSHTITVRATDAATNTGSAATTFAIDTVAPVATITSAPPAEWPVDYFDFAFTVTGATGVECSLNSGAFVACTSPYPVRTTYDVASKLVVRGRDAAGNVGSATATWTARPGLVLHYPWEQGATHNTSLLSQVPALTVDGAESIPPDSVVGGWAGTAIGNAPEMKYPGSERPLQSSPSGAYTMTFWIRATESALTTNLISNPNGMEGGFRLAMEGPTLRLDAFSGGQRFTGQARIQINRWVHVALRTTAPAKPIEVLIDGKLAISVTTTGNAAFGEGQSTLVVGPLGKLDLDDLRFYNLALSNEEVCTRSARGTLSGGSCLPFRPGIELDFETGVVDTGAWRLPFFLEGSATFVPGRTGMAAVLTAGTLRYTSGFREAAAAQPSRSLSFWVDGTNEGIVWDSTYNCGSAAPATCGIRITYRPGQLAIFANGSSQTFPSNGSVPLPGGRNSVVITERRSGTSTTSISVYVNGRGPTVIPINGGDIYAGGSDGVSLMMPGVIVDELELWPGDLSADPERLCENGFDGELDHVTGTCNLTAN